MADIIKVEHLSYVYNPGLPTAVTALDDVSFTVEEGDFVGIIGATGSGKSTLTFASTTSTSYCLLSYQPSPMLYQSP